jgi:hypothetical protein
VTIVWPTGVDPAPPVPATTASRSRSSDSAAFLSSSLYWPLQLGETAGLRGLRRRIPGAAVAVGRAFLCRRVARRLLPADLLADLTLELGQPLAQLARAREAVAQLLPFAVATAAAAGHLIRQPVRASARPSRPCSGWAERGSFCSPRAISRILPATSPPRTSRAAPLKAVLLGLVAAFAAELIETLAERVGALCELLLLAGHPARGVLIAARHGSAGLFAHLPLGAWQAGAPRAAHRRPRGAVRRARIREASAPRP